MNFVIEIGKIFIRCDIYQLMAIIATMGIAAWDLGLIYQNTRIIWAARRDVKPNRINLHVDCVEYCHMLVDARRDNQWTSLALLATTVFLMATGIWSYWALLPSVLAIFNQLVMKEFLLNTEDAHAQRALKEGKATDLPWETIQRIHITLGEEA